MIQQALEQRWPIEPLHRKALVQRLVRIIANPESTNREVTAASKALIAAEAQNAADEQHVDRMDAGRNRILDIVARIDTRESLGITDDRGEAIVNQSNAEPRDR